MEDKRIIKTKKAIYQALKELYLENDFEDISITQLTEKANILLDFLPNIKTLHPMAF